MAVSINSLKWLVLFKVFQFVLIKRKIIAKRWNNRYPRWIIFPVSPHTFHDFSKLFHPTYYGHFPWFSRPGKFTMWIPNFSRLFQDLYEPYQQLFKNFLNKLNVRWLSRCRQFLRLSLLSQCFVCRIVCSLGIIIKKYSANYFTECNAIETL